MIKKFVRRLLPKKFVQRYYLWLCKCNSKKNYEQVEKLISKKYHKVMRNDIDWESPVSYSEKISIAKVYGASPLKKELADKVAVRKWVEDKIGKKYLVPVIGVYDKMKEVPFDELPEQFVIKCSHDSASTTVVQAKSKLRKKIFHN